MMTLDRQVLVLNRLWQPVNICGVRRAFSLLFLGHAQVVQTDEGANFLTHDFDSWLRLSVAHKGNDVVHTIAHCVRIPAIIVLKGYDRLPKQEIKFTRQNVFERDRYTCQYCGTRYESSELNLDHVIPRDKGGRTSWENVVCSCIRCNTRKANKMPAQANMFPMNKPSSPKWRPLFGASPGRPVKMAHDSWRHFIDPGHARVRMSA